jgi:hypothetical protein
MSQKPILLGRLLGSLSVENETSFVVLYKGILAKAILAESRFLKQRDRQWLGMILFLIDYVLS